MRHLILACLLGMFIGGIITTSYTIWAADPIPVALRLRTVDWFFTKLDRTEIIVEEYKHGQANVSARYIFRNVDSIHGISGTAQSDSSSNSNSNNNTGNHNN